MQKELRKEEKTLGHVGGARRGRSRRELGSLSVSCSTLPRRLPRDSPRSKTLEWGGGLGSATAKELLVPESPAVGHITALER